MTEFGPGGPVLYLREEELRRGAELIIRAYHALADAGDVALADQGLGRPHHRVLLLIVRQPGLRVSDMLHQLRVRKQSLQPVLDLLRARNLIEIRAASTDRRRRCLYPTDAGIALESSLFRAIRERMANAYRAAGPQAVAGFWEVLQTLAGHNPRRGG